MHQNTLTVFVGHDGQMIEVTQKTFRTRRDPVTGLAEYLPEQASSDPDSSHALSGAGEAIITSDDSDDSFARIDVRTDLPTGW
jgi:hypothetical protein